MIRSDFSNCKKLTVKNYNPGNLTLAYQSMRRCTSLLSILRVLKPLNFNPFSRPRMKHSGMSNCELLYLLVVGTSYDNGLKLRNHLLDTRYISCKHTINRQPFVVASMEAGKWNEMQYYIGKCTSEKDIERLKEIRGRNVKENVAKALDQHFQDLTTKKGKSR